MTEPDPNVSSKVDVSLRQNHDFQAKCCKNTSATAPRPSRGLADNQPFQFVKIHSVSSFLGLCMYSPIKLALESIFRRLWFQK